MPFSNQNVFHFGYLPGEYLTPKQAALMEAWGTSLKRFPWQWYVTLTFKYDVSTNAAPTKLRRWLRLLSRRRNRTVGYFAILEPHVNRQVYHIHLLLLGVGNLQPRTWEAKWHFGHARIYPYRADQGAVYYLAKKIATNQAEDYFFGGILKNADKAKEIMKEINIPKNT